MSRTQRMFTRHVSDSGQVLIMTGLVLTILFGVMGLSIDAGYLYYEKRRMQVAADAAAIAAALELWKGNASGYVPAAHTDAQLNGFHSSDGATVAVNRPPTMGPRTGNTAFVEVIISRTTNSSLMAVLGFGGTLVKARAVAGLINAPDACIYILEPTDEKAFLIESNSYVDARCGVRVNSSNANALTLASDGHLDAKTIDVVGNYTSTSGSTVDVDPDNDGQQSFVAPYTPPNTGAGTFSDPMANVAPPTFSTACNSSDPNWRGTDVKTSSATVTLQPGVYCGGLSIESGSNVTLSPGTYIMYGKGFRTASGSTVNGTGVTIYNTYPGSPKGGCGDYKGIVVDSNSVANLSAPTEGAMEGMLFFQDRSILRTNGCEQSKIESNVSSHLDGTLYFPTTTLAIMSNTIVVSDWALIIANKLHVLSGTTFNNTFNTSSSFSTPQMIRPALVE